MVQELIWLVLLLAILYRLFHASYPKGFPPGPAWKLPFLGNILTITRPDMLSGLDWMTEHFGKICGFYYGQQLTVLVSDVKLIKKIGINHATNQRQFLHGLTDMQGSIMDGKRQEMAGILISSNDNWKEQRNFALTALKTMGMGKQPMQERILEEVEILCGQLKAMKQKPVDVGSTFRLPALNSLWISVAGEKIKHDDSKSVAIANMANQMTKFVSNPFGQLVIRHKSLYNFLKHTMPPSFFACFKQRLNFVKQKVKEHEETFDKDKIRDLTDMYIKKTRGELDPSSFFHGTNGKNNMLAALMNIFAAADTVNIALMWSMLYMVLYPDVQARVQEELDSLDQDLMYPQDQSKTPFTNATLHEVLRISGIIPQASRIASDNTQIGPYAIPKGTRITLNYYHASRDPDFFRNPSTFDPSRFMNEEGKFVPFPFDLPFGYGKRRCPGESFAKMALYTFFTRIVQHFEISKLHPNDHISEKPDIAAVMPPRPFKVKFVVRRKI